MIQTENCIYQDRMDGAANSGRVLLFEQHRSDTLVRGKWW